MAYTRSMSHENVCVDLLNAENWNEAEVKITKTTRRRINHEKMATVTARLKMNIWAWR